MFRGEVPPGKRTPRISLPWGFLLCDFLGALGIEKPAELFGVTWITGTKQQPLQVTWNRIMTRALIPVGRDARG